MTRTETRTREPEQETALEPAMSSKDKAVQIGNMFDARRAQMLDLLGQDERLVDRFKTVALAAIVKDSNLLDADPLSLLNAIRDAAQMGLEPAGPLGEGAIVARWDKEQKRYIAQFQPMFRGLRKLALQSPGVTVVNVGIRHEKDEWEYREGTDPFIRHIPWQDDEDPGAVMGAYAYARFNGETLALYMNTAELLKRRRVARTDRIWIAWEEEMMKKTVAARLVREKLPMTPRLGMAVSVEEADLEPVTISVPARTGIAAPGSRTRARLIAGDDVGDNGPETPQEPPRGPEGSAAESQGTDERPVAPEPSDPEPEVDPNVAAAMQLAREQGR
jgi:phage RecT family recombinase